jgi:hypothetical protein
MRSNTKIALGIMLLPALIGIPLLWQGCRGKRSRYYRCETADREPGLVWVDVDGPEINTFLYEA